MKQRIEIFSMEQQFNGECLEVVVSLRIKGNDYKLVYKVEGGVREVPQLTDAVVVTFLPYAIKYDLDYFSDYPISKQLYYNLKKHVIPQISMFYGNREDKIAIKMPLSDEEFCGEWIGTGVSLGIDSFTTIHEYQEDDIPEEFRLNTLVHLKTGAHHGLLGRYDKQTEDALFKGENERVKRYCKNNNYHLVTVETNLFEITYAEFGYSFVPTHTCRNLGTVMLLQNYFNKYYYASAYNLDDFEVSFNGGTAHYEKWLMPYISNKSISFYSANEDMSREEKTKYITQFKDTYDTLHVCWAETKNCGVCSKCMRTIFTLDALGELDKYKNSFDLEKYKKDKEFLICLMLLKKKRNPFINEVYLFMKNSNMPMPSGFKIITVFLKHYIKKLKEIGFRSFIKKIKQKLKRA